MKKKFRKTISGVFFLILGLFCVDIVMGNVGSYLFSRMPDFKSDFVKVNYIIDRVEDNFLCMGSSRARHHYVPEILMDSLFCFPDGGERFYNAGLDGFFLESNLCFLECVLERYTPRMVILETSDHELYRDDSPELLRLAPYYHRNPPVTKYLNQMDGRTRLALQSSLYRYNSKLLRACSAILKPGPPNDGYQPLFSERSVLQLEESVLEEKLGKKGSLHIQERVEKHLREVMRKCKSRGILLVLATSPHYRSEEKNVEIARLSAEEDIPYLDFESSEFFNAHPDLFYDSDHLNAKGAACYTRLFCQSFRELSLPISLKRIPSGASMHKMDSCAHRFR